MSMNKTIRALLWSIFIWLQSCPLRAYLIEQRNLDQPLKIISQTNSDGSRFDAPCTNLGKILYGPRQCKNNKEYLLPPDVSSKLTIRNEIKKPLMKMKDIYRIPKDRFPYIGKTIRWPLKRNMVLRQIKSVGQKLLKCTYNPHRVCYWIDTNGAMHGKSSITSTRLHRIF